MSKKKPSVGGPEQYRLPIEQPSHSRLLAGSARTKEAVREALATALDQCGRSREDVADELSRLVGETVSINSLNSWCAEGKSDRRLPLEYAAALVIITGNPGIIEAALSGSGFRLLSPDQVPLYELGQITAEDMALRERRKLIRGKIGI